MTVESSQAEGQHEQYCTRWMLVSPSRCSQGPLEGLWRLTEDHTGEEGEKVLACHPLSFLAPIHVFSRHTPSPWSLQTVHLPAGAGQTLKQVE